MALYNETKLQIFYSTWLLNYIKIPCNSVTLSTLTKIEPEVIRVYLHKYRSYFHIRIDKKHTLGCRYLYRLNKKGNSTIDQLIVRKKNGYHLNLFKRPYEVDYSEFKIMPGIDDFKEKHGLDIKARMKKYGWE